MISRQGLIESISLGFSTRRHNDNANKQINAFDVFIFWGFGIMFRLEGAPNKHTKRDFVLAHNKYKQTHILGLKVQVEDESDGI